jgi:hypothetical protein
MSATFRVSVKGETMKTVALGLAASLALCTPAMVRGAEETVDASQIRIRRAIAEKLTPEQLQARKERLARRIAARRARGHLGAPVGGDAPADTCPAASPETATLPFGATDTTVGMTNDYEPAPSPTLICSAPTNCVGRPSGRGEVYSGTGWGPDKAYAIRTDANCSLTIDLNPTDTTPNEDDLSLLVFQTQCTNDLIDCACASDNGFPGNPDPNGNTEGVVLEAIADTDYFIVIDGYSSAEAPPGDEGPFTLSIAGTGCNLVTPPTQYHTVTPCRLIDTRGPDGPFGGPALAAGANRTFTVAGSCGVPANATAVFLNATIVSPTVTGNLRIFPTGAPVPTVSALNFSADQVRGNNGVYSLDAQGRFDIRLAQASGTAHLVVDVAGYFIE